MEIFSQTRLDSDFFQPRTGTSLDNAFFDGEDELIPSLFQPAESGYLDFHSLEHDEDPTPQKNALAWFRTDSGRAVTILMEAEDEVEIVKVVEHCNGENQIRRAGSCRPCLFGPAPKDDDIDYDSDHDDLDEDDVLTELQQIPEVFIRKNRGMSWLRTNSLGEAMSKPSTPRLVMDALGNFVVPGQSIDDADNFLAHRKLAQKRHPKTVNDKRDPVVQEKKPVSSFQKLRNRITAISSRH